MSHSFIERATRRGTTVMKQIKDCGDDRNKGWCVFCGGVCETKDHVPSRVLLDEPYPANLPAVPACAKCNGSFSRDEEYLACLIECALTGSTAQAANRPKIRGILTRSPALAKRLNDARYETDGQTGFSAENDRVRTVLIKLARGHVAYEQNEPQLGEPTSILIGPITAMSDEQLAAFEVSNCSHELWPEVGSRAMHRVFSGHDLGDGGWLEVQPDLYRYRVQCACGFRVQMVIREYLMSEIAWQYN